MKTIYVRRLVVAVALCFLMCRPGSAAVKISPIPQPPPTAKLRVFVVSVTKESKTSRRPVLWQVSPEEVDRRHKQAINERLKHRGIYEVVLPHHIQAVLGDQTIASWEWTARDWALAKEVGKALYADYVIMVERSKEIHLQFDTQLVNLSNGKTFEASGYIPSNMLRQMTREQVKLAGAEVFKIQFRQLFQESKSDLLQTAIQKGKVAARQPAAAQSDTRPLIKTSSGPEHRKDDAASPHPVSTLPDPAENAMETRAKSTSPVNRIADGKIIGKQAAFEKELEKALSAKDGKTGSPRLVVYDFETAGHMKVVGLILTEALREELYNLGGFMLVNRENILKIMEEYKLQQSGLVDEAQAVRMGKWLAASEAVTGNLATLGATGILQVKRINIQTLSTIALGSLKYPAGREDELLDQMPQLARKLTQPRQ